ncbi:MAG: phosphosulfolactate synthase [Methylobacter sp.]
MIQSANPTDERAFGFLRINEREAKPRKRGITEIRGPYYTPMGKRYLQDVLETMGTYVDALKFAGGSFSLMPRQVVKELIDLCHSHDVQVSTGGFIEHVLTQGQEAVDQYVRECKALGFDIIEISCGFIVIPTDDWLRVRRQLPCPVGDNYLDRLNDMQDNGVFHFNVESTLVWKTYHSTTREFIYEQTSTRSEPRNSRRLCLYF